MVQGATLPWMPEPKKHTMKRKAAMEGEMKEITAVKGPVKCL